MVVFVSVVWGRFSVLVSVSVQTQVVDGSVTVSRKQQDDV